MLELGAEEVRLKLIEVLFRVAEDDVAKGLHRLAVGPRRNSAVHEPLVVHVLVGNVEHGLGREEEFRRRIHADALPVKEVPVVVEALIHGVEPERRAIADRRVRIDLQAVLSEGVHADLEAGEGFSEDAFFRDAVQNAARAAAAEQERVRPPEDFDLLKVVERAVVLDVVAHAVDEEVGGGSNAPEDDGVPVAFALGVADAGCVVDDFRDAREPAGVDLLRRDDREALGHVDDRRRRFESGHLVGVKRFPNDDDGVRRVRRRRGVETVCVGDGDRRDGEGRDGAGQGGCDGARGRCIHFRTLKQN